MRFLRVVTILLAVSLVHVVSTQALKAQDSPVSLSDPTVPAHSPDESEGGPSQAAGGDQATPAQQIADTPMTVTCTSELGQRQHCPADTSAGVALLRSTGPAACLLGNTWGYDNQGVWVSDGCGGEFTLGQGAAGSAAPIGVTAPPAYVPREDWSVLDTTGGGFLIGRTKFAELSIGGYALVRFIDQLPATQSFTDHLGNVHSIDTRRDIQFHRAMLHFKGWLGVPRLRYQITVWSVLSTSQTTLYGYIGYQAHKYFNLYAGIGSTGGSRSLFGSHPFWLANDRVMADEFFRGSFSGVVYANGEVYPGLWYQVTLGNNFSQLGITAGQITRYMATGATIWWMPTTHEFGPMGSYSDWEYHEQVATRFGVSSTRSRENRQNNVSNQTSPDNTSVKLADSLNAFQIGALAPGVSLQDVNARILAFDAGMKYRGVFLQTEYYTRWLNDFEADGPLPLTSIVDKGFYVQAAFFPIKKKLELYGVTSWVFGDKRVGFSTSHEWIQGGNFYPFNSRNYRVNFQVIEVDRSPVSSSFGFYVGGQKGTTVSAAASIWF